MTVLSAICYLDLTYCDSVILAFFLGDTGWAKEN